MMRALLLAAALSATAAPPPPRRRSIADSPDFDRLPAVEKRARRGERYRRELARAARADAGCPACEGGELARANEPREACS